MGIEWVRFDGMKGGWEGGYLWGMFGIELNGYGALGEEIS